MEEIYGWFNFQEIYLKMISEYGNDSHFIEVGSWLGKSAYFMASEIKKSCKKIRFDCIDVWDIVSDDPIEDYKKWVAQYGDIYYGFLKNMQDRGVLGNMTPIKLTSVKAATLYKDNSIDFVFIDANHAYDFIREDIRVWLPKVKKGGWIGGHDYFMSGVKQAVIEVFSDKVNIEYGCWMCKVG